jgi:hypothetical protein
MELESEYDSLCEDDLDFKKHIVKGDTIVYKASGSFSGNDHNKIMVETRNALVPYIGQKDEVAINCGHSKENLQFDIPRLILDSLYMGIEFYKTLSNKTKVITHLFNDFSIADKMIWNSYRKKGAPFPEIYREKITQTIGKNIVLMSLKDYLLIRNLLIQKKYGHRTGHSIVHCFDNQYELDNLSSKIKIIQFFERTLKNKSKAIFKEGYNSGKIKSIEDYYRLDLKKTGIDIRIGLVSGWNTKTDFKKASNKKADVDKNYCSVTPTCRMMQAAELKYKKELGFDMVINCFSGTEYDCQGMFAEIFFRLFEPKSYLDLINIYFYEDAIGGLSIVYDYYTMKPYKKNCFLINS